MSLPFDAFSQRPILNDQELISESVFKEIDEVFKSAEFRKQMNKKFADVKGKVVVDIGVIQSGKVSTFFKVSSEISNFDFIDFMSDYILNHKFRFKLPKKQQYKIRYTAHFNQ